MGYYVVYLQNIVGVSNIESGIMRPIWDGQCPCLDLSELKQQQNVKLVCLRCYVCVVEGSTRCSLKINTPRMISIKQKVMDHCDKW